MAKRFEELEVWQLSRQLVNEIYDINFKGNYSLASQIQRAAISIMSNIAEGFERNGNQEFVQFLYIAKGSCGELRCQLYITLDRKFIGAVEFQKLSKNAMNISVKLSNLISHMKNSRFLGIKYKKHVERPLQQIAEEILKEIEEEKNGGSKVVQK